MDPRPSQLDPAVSADLGAHRPWIRSLALRLVRDAARADDLVQETFLAALEQRPSAGRSLRPWLRSVLTRRFAFGLRSDERRRARERESAAHEELPSSSELAEEAEQHARLVQALARLREPYRTALLLRYYEGLAPAAIAERLDLPGATVRSHLKRGLDELRAQLDREQGGERRAWCLALAPLAASAPDAWTFANPFASTLDSLKTMHPLVHVIVASGALLLTGTYVAQQFDGHGPEDLSLEPGAPGLMERDSHAAPSIASTSKSVRAPDPNEAAASTVGGTLAASFEEGEPVFGFIRDHETGTPVEAYEFGVRLEGDEGDWEACFTDENGRFESEGLYAEGVEISTYLRDPDCLQVLRTQRQVLPSSFGTGMSLTLKPDILPLEFPVVVGPTVKLAPSAPFEIDPAQLVATLEVTQRAPWGPLPSSYQLRSPIHVGEPLWTRFIPVYDNLLPSDRPWLLRLETTDGLWAAEVELAASEVGQGEALPLELSPAARLNVEVLAATEYSDLVVHAEGLADGLRRILSPNGDEELADGGHEYRFQLMALPAGTYQVSVSSEGVEQVTSNVSLVAGQAHEEEIELAAGPGLSHIRGELRSLSGQYELPMTLYLYGSTTSTRMIRTPKWEQQDDGWVAPFLFDNLPADTYHFQLSSWGDHYRWDGLTGEVSLPEDELVLTCRDTDSVRRIEVAVEDALTGEAIPKAIVILTADGCAWASGRVSTGDDLTSFPKVPTDAAVDWWVRADGYVPRFGDESDVIVTDDVGLIEVDMQPGWGARIEVKDGTTKLPLADVAVSLDGALAGSTDAEGRIDLEAQGAPTHVDLVLEGWQFSTGGYDPEARALTGYGPKYGIYFKPVP